MCSASSESQSSESSTGPQSSQSSVVITSPIRPRLTEAPHTNQQASQDVQEALRMSPETTQTFSRPPQPAKRQRPTWRGSSRTPNTASIPVNSQSRSGVVPDSPPGIVIYSPRRSPSPPATTIYLQGMFLQPGDSQYEHARAETGSNSPYWFSGDNSLAWYDMARRTDDAQGIWTLEREAEAVEIRLDEEEISENKKGKRRSVPCV